MAISLLERFLRLFAWRPKVAPLADRVRDVVRDQFSPCPVCGGCVSGHSFVKLASAIVNDDAGTDQLLERLILNHQWKQASECQDWNSDSSMREYFLLRCPQGSQIALIRLLSTPEMWTDDQIGPSQTLAPHESEAVLEVAGDKWISL